MPETELESMVVRLLGDGRSYERMLTGAVQRSRQTARAIERMGVRIERIGDRIEGVGRRVRQVGRTFSTFVTAPIVGIGALATREFAGFETSLARIEGLVGLSAQVVREFRGDILSLAGPTARAPRELGEAMFFITSAGLRGANALEALERSARAATAGLGDTRNVADLVTSAMNAYGPEMLNAAMATDILVAAVREGKAEAPELASSLGQVLPVASALGVSFDQVGAAVAAMTRTGTNAQTAAIQLRQILASILNPAAGARNALADMGLSAAELRKQLREEGLIALLQTLQERAEGNEEAMGLVFGNIRALAGVLDIVGANLEENVGIFERMEDTTGALDRAFAAVTGTLSVRWDRAMARSQVALEDVGEAIKRVAIPILDSLVDNVELALKAWQELSDETQDAIVIGAAIAAGVGPAALALGGFVSVIGFTINGLGAMVGALGLLVSPIGLVTAAFVGLGAVILTQTNAGQAAVEGLMRLFGELGAIVEPVFRGIQDALRSGDLELAGEILKAGLTLAFEELRDDVTTIWEETLTGLQVLLTEFSAVAGESFVFIEGKATEAFSRLGLELAKLIVDTKQFTGQISDISARAQRDFIDRGLEALGPATEQQIARRQEQIRINAEKIAQGFGAGLDETLRGSEARVDAAQQELNRLIGQAAAAARETGLPSGAPPEPRARRAGGGDEEGTRRREPAPFATVEASLLGTAESQARFLEFMSGRAIPGQGAAMQENTVERNTKRTADMAERLVELQEDQVRRASTNNGLQPANLGVASS